MMVTRAATDADSDGLIRLIETVYQEYPGCVLDLEEEPALLTPASSFAEEFGTLWVVEDKATIVACGGYVMSPLEEPDDPPMIELRKLYVAASHRRQGIANQLCQRVEDAARRHSILSLELWSDTRFVDAHRLYQRRGYLRCGHRTLHDRSQSKEYYFRLDLEPTPTA